MQPTSVIGFLSLIVVGVIAADLLANPKNTAAAGNVATTFWSTTIKGLLGQA